MRALFEAIFESAPDAMIITDLQGRIVNINNQTVRLFGYAKNELIGKPVEILIPPALTDRHRTHRKNYLQSPKTRQMGNGMILKAIKKDGSEFNAEISLSPISEDTPVYVSAAIRDVTEKKQLLDKLQKSEAQLHEQNERLNNFAHIVSHNLRSYAGNFQIMLQLFEDATPSESADIMSHLKKTSAALVDTIQDLDKVVSVQSFRREQLEKVNMKRCLEKITEILKPEIDRHEVTIEDHIADETELEYIPAYLESILFNLLSNSIKYRDPARKPVITIRSVVNNSKLVLEVSDNGLGIDLARHGEKLFGMYKTFHGNKDAKGVGLFITRKQVEALGGRIEVQSEPGKGTTFKIFFA